MKIDEVGLYVKQVTYGICVIAQMMAIQSWQGCQPFGKRFGRNFALNFVV